MILPEIPHTSPSFIMAYQIDEKLCDMIVENFEDVKKLTQYDKIRGYHRLPESKLDSDILENSKTYTFVCGKRCDPGIILL